MRDDNKDEEIWSGAHLHIEMLLRLIIIWQHGNVAYESR